MDDLTLESARICQECKRSFLPYSQNLDLMIDMFSWEDKCSEDEEARLNHDETELERIKELLYQYPSSEMETHLVSTAINNVENDSKDLVELINSK